MGTTFSQELKRILITGLVALSLTLAASADSAQYTDEAQGFQLGQTQGWEANSDGKLTFTAPESTDRETINFTVQVIPAQDFTAEQFAQVIKAKADQSFRGKVIQETQTTLDGNPALELVWENQRNAQNCRNITLVSVKDGKLYMLNGRVPKARYDELQPRITGFVESFSFL